MLKGWNLSARRRSNREQTRKDIPRFNIYGRVPTHAGGSVRVQDSSLAFEGPHVWLFLDGEQCVEHLGQHMKPDPQLNVEQAKQLRDALNAFIAAAEGDELTEPKP